MKVAGRFPGNDRQRFRGRNTPARRRARHDERIPLSQIAQRVRHVLGDTISPWLTLIVDGALDAEQATEVVRQRWEDWGVRVVITVNPRNATALESRSQGRCFEVALFISFSSGGPVFYG